MSRLGSAGIVEALHGKHDGYRIALPLAKIRLADVIDIVEGLESYDRCILGFETGDDKNPCPLHAQWRGHKGRIRNMLDQTTLADRW